MFGVVFGRYEGALADTAALAKEIEKGEYDFVRLKITDAKEDLFIKLHELDTPYQLIGIIRQYTVDVQQYTPRAIENKDIEFIPYTLEKKTLLKNLIKSSYDELPMGYFKNEVLDKYFTRDLQIENFAEYIATRFAGSTMPGNLTWIIKYEGLYAGCIAMQCMENETYTHYIGLLPEARKKSIFYDIIRFIQLTTRQAGLTWASGGARLNNLASQIVFERENSHYKYHDYIVMLMPCLSLKKKAKDDPEGEIFITGNKA